MDVVTSLSLLELDKVDSSWAETVWSDEFCGVEDLPIEYQMHLVDADTEIIMETAIRAVKEDLQNASRRTSANPIATTSRDNPRQQDDSISWEHLIANNINHKELLAILCYFVHNGQDFSKDLTLTKLCLKSARLYFALLAIPGSSAFLIYHPNLYRKALDVFDIARKLMKSNKNKQRPKNRGRQKNARSKKQGDSDEDDDDDMDSGTLPAEDVNVLISELNLVLLDLIVFSERFSLKMDDALLQTILHLIEVTKLEVFPRNDFSSVSKQMTIVSLVGNAFVALYSLCTPNHGKIDLTVKLIMENLLPCVLMTDSSRDGPNTLRQTISFIQYMLKALPEGTCEGIYILVQHLCAHITDRAEFRQKGSQSVVEILRFMPIDLYTRFVKWFFKFAHASKASHRLFALDVISKLLQERERTELTQSFIHCSSQNSSTNISLNLQNMSSGINMEVNCPSENVSVIDSNSVNQCESSVQNCSDPSLQSVDASLQIGVNVNADSTQNSDIVDENVSLNANKSPSVSHKYVLGTVFSRCQDLSGTVRTKALSVLADCINSNNSDIQKIMQAVFVLPYENVPEISCVITAENSLLNHKKFMKFIEGDSTTDFNPIPKAEAVLSEMFQRAAEDKVFVRKAAFQVMDSIMKLNRQWVLNDILQLMGGHCLDPAVLIRKHMVQSLSELLCYYPDHEGLQAVVVESVLPRISDPETKVQEKVFEAFHRIIVCNIVPFEKEYTDSHKLPWQIIKRVLDKSMKRLLSKTCSFWCKNNMISTGVVNAMHTHIGTPNECPVWLLLSCIAENMRIPKVQFVLDYFLENFRDYKEKEYELLSALEVLFFNWKAIKSEDQQRLGAELLRAVYCMELPISLISPALDVLATIARDHAKSPEEADTTWAAQFIEMCEDYIKEHHPDTGKMPNVPEFSRYIFAIGEASQYCPEEVEKDTEYRLVKLLFPKKLPVPLENTPLQAMAVITLGKMSLQNDLFAKDVVSLLGCVLRETDDIIVKVNVINVLADLCIRYTSMVEPLIPDICVCLKDPREKVRETALVQLIQLLQQDYLKLRGSFYFNIFSMLCDKDKTIVDSIIYFITESLLVKNKNILYQNFVAGLYYYNKCETEDMFMRTTQTQKEAEVFDLSGEDNAEKRMTLYKFMLEHMTDEHRFKITYKVCMDILGAVVNDKMSLNGAGRHVLKDSLTVLACDEIKLSSLRSQGEEEPAADESEAAAAVLTTAKKTIISQCVKRNTIENIVPVVIQLKTKLQAAMSPLVLDLMSYIKELMRDFKNEIKEIFADDKTLAAEILFDLKKHEEQQKQLEAQIAASRQAASCDTVVDGEIEPVPSTSSGNSPQTVIEKPVGKGEAGTPSAKEQSKNMINETGRSIQRLSSKTPNTKQSHGDNQKRKSLSNNENRSEAHVTPGTNTTGKSSNTNRLSESNADESRKKRNSNKSKPAEMQETPRTTSSAREQRKSIVQMSAVRTPVSNSNTSGDKDKLSARTPAATAKSGTVTEARTSQPTVCSSVAAAGITKTPTKGTSEPVSDHAFITPKPVSERVSNSGATLRRSNSRAGTSSETASTSNHPNTIKSAASKDIPETPRTSRRQSIQIQSDSLDLAGSHRLGKEQTHTNSSQDSDISSHNRISTNGAPSPVTGSFDSKIASKEDGKATPKNKTLKVGVHSSNESSSNVQDKRGENQHMKEKHKVSVSNKSRSTSSTTEKELTNHGHKRGVKRTAVSPPVSPENSVTDDTTSVNRRRRKKEISTQS
ncbi:condensin-2 complex subunit D3-like [Schistocerca piceifrons]|uniref:condensin-2 complex subunit D3-like n=1 Tax=Schistocerca piceifrons TaxID=274613 RepID=UPI001F5EAE21|nr:condensin-2 complex subunit D3-like [Schistocerca piceifrons]